MRCFYYLLRSKWFLISVVLMFVLMIGQTNVSAAGTDYADKLFDPSYVHSIEIRLSPEDWEDLKADPLPKTKYHADVTIDGESFGNVSFSTKGNSSLKMVARSGDSDRYSFRINFKKFDKGQSYYGLQSLSLNNSFQDSSYVKDFLSYTMFRRAGVDAPLCSFAWIKVNGTDHSLYLAVEDLDESFLNRTGRSGGVLYKPDSDKLDADGDEMARIIRDGIQVEDYGEGAELGYRGENIGDYPNIFERAETEAGEADYRRVIEALKGLAEGKAPETILELDEVIRYFAVHNFLLNFDSYTGPMLHNYYLYEKDGKLSLFPWDYNLSFGAFWEHITGKSADTAELLNKGIDTPLLGSLEEQRPMWRWILENERFRGIYHQAVDAFISDYFESGAFRAETDALYAMLLPYVEKDPTAFFTAEEFTSTFRSLQDFCMLRAESYRRQLDGKLAAESENQLPLDRVDPGTLTISGLR